MQKYGEAVADFDKAIVLDESSDWNWYNKALIYLLTDQQALFRKTIRVALNMARSQIEHFIKQDENYYRLRFNAALYLLVDGSLEAAEADYCQLLSICSFVSRLRGAAADLEDFLLVQPMNEFAQNIHTLVKNVLKK